MHSIFENGVKCKKQNVDGQQQNGVYELQMPKSSARAKKSFYLKLTVHIAW